MNGPTVLLGILIIGGAIAGNAVAKAHGWFGAVLVLELLVVPGILILFLGIVAGDPPTKSNPMAQLDPNDPLHDMGGF